MHAKPPLQLLELFGGELHRIARFWVGTPSRDPHGPRPKARAGVLALAEGQGGQAGGHQGNRPVLAPDQGKSDHGTPELGTPKHGMIDRAARGTYTTAELLGIKPAGGLANPSRFVGAVGCHPLQLGSALAATQLQASPFQASPLQAAQGLPAALEPAGRQAGQIGRLGRQRGARQEIKEVVGQGTGGPGLLGKNLLGGNALGEHRLGEHGLGRHWELWPGAQAHIWT